MEQDDREQEDREQEDMKQDGPNKVIWLYFIQFYWNIALFPTIKVIWLYFIQF